MFPTYSQITVDATGTIGTLADLKGLLSITGTGEDADLTTCLDVATGQVEDYCDRHMRQAEIVVRYPQAATRLVYLDDYPASNLVMQYWRRNYSGTYPALPDYDLTNTSILFDKALSPAFQLQLTYDAGYATMPEVVTRATLEAARDIYLREGRSGELAGESVGSIQGVFREPRGLSMTVMEMLSAYRRLVL